MNRTGFNDSYYKLENYYISNLLGRIHSGINREIKTHVWQEVFDNKVEVSPNGYQQFAINQLKPSVTVNAWKYGWTGELDAITKAGQPAVLTSCWYLNMIAYAEDWVPFYQCDPGSFTSKKLNVYRHYFKTSSSIYI